MILLKGRRKQDSLRVTKQSVRLKSRQRVKWMFFKDRILEREVTENLLDEKKLSEVKGDITLGACMCKHITLGEH